jgi:hypothetical protein
MGEPGLGGVQVFSFVLLTAEQQNKFTDTNGSVTFSGVTPDITLVQEVTPTGKLPTSPIGTLGFQYFLPPQVAPGAILSLNFGLKSLTPAIPLITISTDKSSYVQGGTIVIQGRVNSVLQQTPLTIQIFDPSSNLVTKTEIPVPMDGNYSDTITPNGLWTANGFYTVKVQYGPPSVTAQATFAFYNKIGY